MACPALPSKKPVREAIERAWFERQPLRIVYVDGNFIETTRNIRIVSFAMDRHETRVEADDLDTKERRQFRLDRIHAGRALAGYARRISVNHPPLASTVDT